MKEFQITLDDHSGVPLYKQIILQVEMAVADGRLACGNQLPTVRALAAELQINPNTVVRAYNEMEIRGIVNTQQGSGTFISDKKIQFTQEERQKVLKDLVASVVTRTRAYGLTLVDFHTALAEATGNPGPAPGFDETATMELTKGDSHDPLPTKK